MDSEFFAVYRGEDDEPIEFPIVRDNLGSYGLGCADGVQPVRWWVEGKCFTAYSVSFHQNEPSSPNIRVYGTNWKRTEVAYHIRRVRAV
jgi:hypothetical protein